MDEMKHFYSEVLGLPHYNPESENPGWVQFGNDAFRLGLHGAKESGSPKGNSNKLIFFTEDIEQAKSHLADAGVETCDIITWPSKRVIEGFDPEGNKFQIAEIL